MAAAGRPGAGRRRTFRALLVEDRRGAAGVLVALLVPVLLAVSAVAVDASHVYVTKAKLQGAANAAALAAIQDLPDAAAVVETAEFYAYANAGPVERGHILTAGDVAPGHWDADTGTFEPNASPMNAVRVRARRAKDYGSAVPTFFAALLGFDEVDVTAEAVALAGGPPTCILALADGSTGVDLNDAAIAADGCAVHVNSSSADAIVGQSGSELSAAHICVVGGHDGAPTYSPRPVTGCDPMPDPLASLAAPSFDACDYGGEPGDGGDALSIGSGDATLSPGVYCGGLRLTTGGTVTLNPGTYVIRGGPLSIGGGTTVNGAGVSFYLTGSGTYVKMAGGARLNLLAPTSGDMTGVLFFADRALAASTEHELVGGSGIHYEGTLYFPSTTVRFVGNGGATAPSPYTMFIANRFRLNGNASVQVAVFSDYAASAVPPPSGIGARRGRLVR